jgi:hypothetical protein
MPSTGQTSRLRQAKQTRPLHDAKRTSYRTVGAPGDARAPPRASIRRTRYAIRIAYESSKARGRAEALRIDLTNVAVTSSEAKPERHMVRNRDRTSGRPGDARAPPRASIRRTPYAIRRTRYVIRIAYEGVSVGAMRQPFVRPGERRRLRQAKQHPDRFTMRNEGRAGGGRPRGARAWPRASYESARAGAVQRFEQGPEMGLRPAGHFLTARSISRFQFR